MIEFEVAGVAYKAHPMDAMTQFHVMRRLTPVLASFKDLIPLLKAGGGKVDVGSLDIVSLIEPAAQAIAKLSDEDGEFVLSACLRVCSRQQGASWVQVWGKGAKRSSFDDIRLPEMLQIAMAVLLDTFSSFGPGLAPGSSGEAKAK